MSWSSLSNTAFGIGGTFVQTNINGVPPEVITQLVKQQADHSELQRQEIERLATALDVKDGQVRAALKIVYEAYVPLEQQSAKLIEIAERFKALLATSVANPGDSEKIAALKGFGETAIEAGDLTSADEFLAQIEAEQRLSLQRQTAAYAKTLARRGQVALARLRYREAAGHFANAASVLPQTHEYRDAQFDYLNQEADAFYKQGDELGDNASLLLAIERRQALVESKPREQFPLDWALAQHNLGNALQTLGERESGTERLKEGVAVYRAALEERTREQAPLEWAMTQTSLGSALLRLGGRESGVERLEEAVAAHRMALEEYTRKQTPLDWALAQHNLGNAVQTLGERESGTERLEEAVTAYRTALEERTREQVPLDWGLTQHNLGNALQTLGERESGTGRLKEGVAAYRNALEERTRERVPLGWAATQNNLAAKESCPCGPRHRR